MNNTNWFQYLGILLSILPFSLAWNAVFWIKDKINRWLAFFASLGIIVTLLHRSMPSTIDVLMTDDIVIKWVGEIWQHTLFTQNNFALAFLFVPIGCLMMLIFRLIWRWRKS